MYLVRVIIVGDTSVGKTSLLIRFHENNFSTLQKSTIGVDYKAKEVVIDGETVKLQIWDTAGQERFRSMTAAFYNRAQGVIVAFDVTNADSFSSLPQWISDVRRDAPPGCLIVLCANKADMPTSTWKVNRDQYLKFAEDKGFILFEASASTGINVNEMFTELGRMVVATFTAELKESKSGDRGNGLQVSDSSGNLLEENDEESSSSSCC